MVRGTVVEGFLTVLGNDDEFGRAAKGAKVVMGIVESSSWRNCLATFCNC